MKKYMPFNGLRWSRDSGSALYDIPQTAVFGRAGGVTQAQLAELLKVNQAFISKIETCERRLDIIELHHICQVLGISFVDFIQEVDRDILCKNEEESYITIKELKK